MMEDNLVCPLLLLAGLSTNSPGGMITSACKKEKCAMWAKVRYSKHRDHTKPDILMMKARCGLRVV